MGGGKTIKQVIVWKVCKMEYLMMYLRSTWIRKCGTKHTLIQILIIVLGWLPLVLKGLFLFMVDQVIPSMLMLGLVFYGCLIKEVILGKLFKLISIKYVRARKLVINTSIDFIFIFILFYSSKGKILV